MIKEKKNNIYISIFNQQNVMRKQKNNIMYIYIYTHKKNT